MLKAKWLFTQYKQPLVTDTHWKLLVICQWCKQISVVNICYIWRIRCRSMNVTKTLCCLVLIYSWENAEGSLLPKFMAFLVVVVPSLWKRKLRIIYGETKGTLKSSGKEGGTYKSLWDRNNLMHLMSFSSLWAMEQASVLSQNISETNSRSLWTSQGIVVTSNWIWKL